MANEENTLPAGDITTRPPVLAFTDPACRWRNYLFLNKLGEGVYGKVCRTLKLDSSEIVAVKILKRKQQSNHKLRELFILEKIGCLDPDKFNIVKFYESYQMTQQTCLVFEVLDISLDDYMRQRKFHPLPLEDIRCITQQLAVAFNGLKSIGVIHADLKVDNIMLVDRFEKPLRVKLVDFGLAHLTCEAKQGLILQARCWRAPELLLGLPFSEAIDMWSLGCLMSYLFLGFLLFPGRSEYDVICSIIQILDQPQDHLLNAGQMTSMYFNTTPPDVLPQRWSLMTPEEHAMKAGLELKEVTNHCRFSSLDELKDRGPGELSRAEAEDRKEFVNLLKQLFQMDPSERITPREVLTHPFITESHFIKDSHHSYQTDEDVRAASAPPQSTVILVQTNPDVHDIQTEEAAEQQPDRQQTSSQAVPDMISSCQKAVDEGEPAKTEAIPSLNIANVGTPAPDNAEVDSGIEVASVPPLDAEQTHTTPEVSEPKKKKKKNKVRRFFSRLLRTICGCCKKPKVVE